MRRSSFQPAMITCAALEISAAVVGSPSENLTAPIAWSRVALIAERTPLTACSSEWQADPRDAATSDSIVWSNWRAEVAGNETFSVFGKRAFGWPLRIKPGTDSDN